MLTQSIPGPRNLKVLYSPLHGVGTTSVYPVLNEAGFREVEIFGPHAEPNGDFPNIPKHVANPENAAVFDAMIERAKGSGADLILATDPDCDRLGCAVRKALPADAPWVTPTGNQLGSLLADFLLSTARAAGRLTPEHYVVKTLVTTELIRRIADEYGVQTAGDLHVGFKWIGAEIDARGPAKFVFAAEESYGFLVGTHVRDKDAAVASLVTAELAAKLKTEGKTLYQRLDELYRRYGCFSESQVSVQMPGEKGMDDMQTLMAQLRSAPPATVGGQKVARVRDYLRPQNLTPEKVSGTDSPAGWKSEPFDAPTGDLVILDFQADGNYVAIRPSGTEPKVKVYLFAYDPVAAVADLEATKATQAARLKAVGDDVRTMVERVSGA